MIGQRIKEIRNNNNLTQEELADGIISRTYLSLIEKGSVHPSTNVLIKLSERLNCSVNDFMQEVSHFRYNDVEILREIAYYEQKIESDDYQSVISFIEKEYETVDQIPRRTADVSIWSMPSFIIKQANRGKRSIMWIRRSGCCPRFRSIRPT